MKASNFAIDSWFRVRWYFDLKRVQYSKEKSQDRTNQVWIKKRLNSSNFQSVSGRIGMGGCIAVLCFRRPWKCKYSDFRVAYTISIFHIKFSVTKWDFSTVRTVGFLLFSLFPCGLFRKSVYSNSRFIYPTFWSVDHLALKESTFF